jgi:GNAT superfamily N-acetyltransferase
MKHAKQHITKKTNRNQPMAVVIRCATQSDVRRVLNLHEKLESETAASFPYTRTNTARRHVARQWLEAARSGTHDRLFVAVVSRAVIGYALGGFSVPTKAVHNRAVVGLVREFYIIPRFRKRGIGRTLWKELEAFFLDNRVRYCELSYHTVLQSARRFWTRLGFRPYLTTSWRELPIRK